jgi:DNA polymerase
LTEDLQALHQEIRACKACALHHGCTQAVPGHGHPQARIMLVGEAPGFHEDRQGIPFVGNAGQLLNQLLDHIGLKREDVYVTNIVKHRPPGNRDPLPDEVEACASFLDREISIIRPAVILLLGRYAMQRLLPGTEGISRSHGRLIERPGRAYVPLYHPAAALHNGFLLETLKQDFLKVKGYLDEIERRAPVAATASDPVTAPEEQLSLF